MKEKIFWTSLAIVMGLALLLPTAVTREFNAEKEEQEYIRRAFLEHSVGQHFSVDYKMDGIALLLRTDTPANREIVITSQTGAELVRDVRFIGRDDAWHEFTFSEAVPAGENVITLTSDAKTQGEAVLVRFQIDSKRYEAGNMVVDGEESYGDLAFRTQERVPAWEAARTWGQITNWSVRRAGSYVVVAVMLALFAFLALKYGTGKKRWVWIGLLLVVLVSLLIRAPYTRSIEGVFGGDAFNYLSKAEALVHGEDPFASDPRKGPFYSFLLAPGLFSPNPLLWARWVGILAAGLAVGLLPLLAKRFGMPWLIGLGAALLLAVNIQFIWEAPNALANSLYAALIVAAAVAFVEPPDPLIRGRTARQYAVLAVLCGLVTLTRWEGFLVGAVLLPAYWYREKLPLKKAAMMFLIAVAISLLPMISIFWSGQSGIRTVEDLQSDSGLFLATNSEALQENIDAASNHLRDMWVLMREKGRPSHVFEGLGLGLLLGVGLLALDRWRNEEWKTRVRWLLAGALTLTVMYLILTKSSEARDLLAALPWLLSGVGLVAFIKNRRFDGLVILLVIILQLLVVVMILPKSRYFLPLIPFVALWMAMGVYALIATPRFREILSVLVIGLLAGFFYFDSVQQLERHLEWYNGKASVISVMSDAVIWLRAQDGLVGFRPRDEQPVLTMMPRSRRLEFHSKTDDIVQDELDWLRENNIAWAVERNQEPRWLAREDYPEHFELAQTFDTTHGDEKVYVYAIRGF